MEQWSDPSPLPTKQKPQQNKIKVKNNFNNKTLFTAPYRASSYPTSSDTIVRSSELGCRKKGQ